MKKEFAFLIVPTAMEHIRLLPPPLKEFQGKHIPLVPKYGSVQGGIPEPERPDADVVVDTVPQRT